MDYMTKPLSRTGVRNISKLVRRIFNLTPDEPFPVLRILDKLCVTFPRTEYQIVEDDKLPKTVFAWCFPKPEDGFKIEIKQTVYDEACFNNNRPFLCFICHEICHVILFNLGFTPISPRTLGKETSIPAYRSVEQQAKALCGELTIPYEATEGMKAKEICKKFLVIEQSAKYRCKQSKNKQ